MRAGCAGRGRGRTSHGASSPSASRWVRGGRITSSAGAAGGSGIRSRTRSFMPWLAGTALLHSQAVTEKRGSFRGWTLLLAIAAFSLSLLGTFLVRSGVLTSVHAFAADPTRGLFILVFLGHRHRRIAAALRAARAETIDDGAPLRDGVARNAAAGQQPAARPRACAMVLLGTLYPLLAEALDLGQDLGRPAVFRAAVRAADGAAGAAAAVRAADALAARADLAAVRACWCPGPALRSASAIGAFFLAPQGAVESRRRRRGLGVGAGSAPRASCGRAAQAAGSRFTAEMLGMTLAHFGIAVFLVGVLMTEGLSSRTELALAPGQSVALGGHAFRFDGVDARAGSELSSPTSGTRDSARATARARRDDASGKAQLRQRRRRCMTEVGDRSRLDPRSLRRARRAARRAAHGPCACTSSRSCAGSGSARC